jgi:hypothetical protein
VRPRSVATLALVALLPLVAGGCSTSARLQTRYGGSVDAHIAGGSPGSVYLANKQKGKFTMRRDDISDVDYPGNVLALGGAALLGVGAYRLWFGDTSCASPNQAGTCAANVVPAILGLLAAAWGSYSYFHTRHAFDDTSHPEPDPVMKPRPSRAPSSSMPGWRKPDPFADPHP